MTAPAAPTAADAAIRSDSAAERLSAYWRMLADGHAPHAIELAYGYTVRDYGRDLRLSGVGRPA